MSGSIERPGLGEAARVWARIAGLSFGGPAGQIAVMHRILVEEKRWLGDARFLHALNFCMLLPGPEAMQLATYVGWLLHGVRGAVLAGLLFLAPGVAALMTLSWIYALWGGGGLVAGLFFGLKAGVLAIVAQAVLRLAKRALKTRAQRALAVAAFVGLFALALPFPLIVAAAALIGVLGGLIAPAAFAPGGHGAAGGPATPDAETLLGEEHGDPTGAERRAALRAGAVALMLWLLPVAALWLLAPESVFTAIALFFSKLAVLTFGGAYAVLAWVAQAAVTDFGWLRPTEMLDGLGMAETTPGPLIMVLQFVGFMAAFRAAGWEAPLLAGSLGGLLASWVTFAPCFAWIFLGAPFIERLRANRALGAALSAVTAAVVGVIANLALWFALHLLWRGVTRISLGPVSLDLPQMATLDLPATGIAAVAVWALFRRGWGMAAVLAGSAGLGVLAHLAGIA
ncbi:chromate efflux transporter [Rhodobacter capsulatus]|uniref:Chromate transporter n=1 Tax=Rhodobacter capsulatus (strain ATCC BAA-309 / NBRC 16581 / SB1003) TaxID=272942 RepID=D5AVQ8_RHOCB|nr:chromate efflux transporter [Rhodobacter capsulatus]ADE87393.1 chromate transporter [Rhodobacter capsulatus SB 1003]ETE52141.1 chromate transporter [Rhodobacter capsulatus Y262]MDS0927609.1 chromate efflux transporter [Rhodobacter capsulatus]